ncbi:MAG: hypothetical protein KAX20_08090, partial [Candidatus Omnitrophica bacterium]|nr:hypothetical protein [Candidatus Omnitrophota bacterium]
MIKKMNILNFGIMVFFIVLMLGIISIGSASGDMGRHLGPLVMNETEAKNVGLVLESMSSPGRLESSIEARYMDVERASESLTLHYYIKLSKCNPEDHDNINLDHMTKACTCECTYPRCENTVSLGEDDGGLNQYIPAAPCYEGYKNGYTNHKGFGWETVFIQDDILVVIETRSGRGSGTMNDYSWSKGKHDSFVRASVERITSNYPLVLTHTAFACIRPYDYGADSGNELTIGGIVSGPDGDLSGIIVEYMIYYIDSTTEIRVARTDEMGIYGAAYPVTKEIAYIEFSMLNENEFPKYKGAKIISIYDFTGQPPIGDKVVKIENNPKTGKAFTTVAADGVSTLKFILSFPGCT